MLNPSTINTARTVGHASNWTLPILICWFKLLSDIRDRPGLLNQSTINTMKLRNCRFSSESSSVCLGILRLLVEAPLGKDFPLCDLLRHSATFHSYLKSATRIWARSFRGRNISIAGPILADPFPLATRLPHGSPRVSFREFLDDPSAAWISSSFISGISSSCSFKLMTFYASNYEYFQMKARAITNSS